MRTRGLRLHWEHISALNLVEVEYIRHPAVVNAWKEYLPNLQHDFSPSDQIEKFDRAVKKRDMLLTQLIAEIDDAIQIGVSQLDILVGNYVPQS